MKSLLMAIAAFACGWCVASPLDNAVLHGETDKPRAIDYAPGEEMTFTLSLQGAGAFPQGTYFVKWTRTGDDGEKKEGRVDATALPLVVKTKLDQPGFVRIEAFVVDAKGAVFQKSFTGNPNTPEGKKALNAFERKDKRVFFDGGAGVKIDTLQSVPEPKDFDEFWAKRKARLAKVPMTATVRETTNAASTVRILAFSVACAGPRPVTGWVTIPTDKSRKYPAEISFHGYGAHFIQSIPTSGPTDKMHMFINAHGYELGREEEYYTEFYNSIKSNGHTFGLDSVWQNKSKETAYFGWMIYRIMRAMQYLKSFPEWDGKNLLARGGSMGGLQTVWAAGIDPDVSAAKPSIPWCCDMGGRKTLKRMSPGWGVDETEVMRYFDPVNFAKRVNPKCKVEITRAGLGDYCCPPSGIAVLYNNLRCDKKINWVQGSTHGYVPEEEHQKFTLASGITETVSGRTGADVQKAIDAVATAGGGKVEVPAGVYDVGSILLKSGVELHLAAGAILKGGAKSSDYDDFPDSICSIHPEKSKKVFIYAYDAHDIAITGEGVVEGQGPLFFDTKTITDWGFYPKPPCQRPRMVQFVRCTGVRLEGVTFKDSPCWTMLIRLCEDILVDGITITGEQRMLNNDGIDFDGCRKVRVFNSKFKTGDDCLILRAMREKGSAEKIVCEDVIVSNCVLNSTCQTIRLGCPSDDTIRNALFTDIVAEGHNGIFADFPVRYLRPDDSGYMDIHDITVRNYRGNFRNSAVQIVSEPGVKVRNVDKFVFRNLNVTSAKPLRLIGNKGAEIKSVRFENVSVEVPGEGPACIVKGCDGLVFKNVTMRGVKQSDGPVVSEPGSSAPMAARRRISWESENQVKTK